VTYDVRPVLVVHGVEARSVADCPFRVSSPEGVAWCREFARVQAGDLASRLIAKAEADDRIEATFGPEARPAPDPIQVATRSLLDAWIEALKFAAEAFETIGPLLQSLEVDSE
jgi:hypothetical protein